MTKTTDIDYALYGMQVYYDIIFSSVPLTKQIIQRTLKQKIKIYLN